MIVPIFYTGVNDAKGHKLMFHAGSVQKIRAHGSSGRIVSTAPRNFTKNEVRKIQNVMNKFKNAKVMKKGGKIVIRH